MMCNRSRTLKFSMIASNRFIQTFSFEWSSINEESGNSFIGGGGWDLNHLLFTGLICVYQYKQKDELNGCFTYKMYASRFYCRVENYAFDRFNRVHVGQELCVNLLIP
jgi:hypothetical protein